MPRDEALRKQNAIDARDALLESIKTAAATSNAADLRRLAEAWAWLISPAESHGGGSAAQTT